jgi:hypothetical protein
MKQYRIIRISNIENSHYKVQEKGWFFWSDVVCWDAWLDVTFYERFQTIEEAEQWINRQRKPIETVVKEITIS